MDVRRILLNIESGYIFSKNENAEECIYLFIYTQQNLKKELLKLDLSYAGDVDSNLSTYFTAIKLVNYNSYDTATTKNKRSKFQIYQFNDFLKRNERLRQTITLQPQLSGQGELF